MKILLPGLIVFTVWCVISVRWYVCGIHELCDSDQVSATENEKDASAITDEILTNDNQDPLAFGWSSADPITNDRFDNLRDSLREVFDSSPAAVVEITGLYDPQELNNSEFDNLGIARAENIKQLMLASGIKRSFRTKSAIEDLSSGLSGDRIPAYSIELVPQEIKTNGFLITEAEHKIVIHFPYNRASPDSDQQVQQALKKLARNAININRSLLVVGHTDSNGDAFINKKLGLLRATEVKDLLLSYGMREKDVLAESEGEETPLVSNTTTQGRKQNRRVEITMI